ncbi:MAG: 3-oxoadipate enol-lactonase [Actinomycetota bacterium]|nr:MAG: 3-oxoadipate enol-lactonase [Actinomycetota bacterium]
MELLQVNVNGVRFRVRIDGSEGSPWLLMLNSLSTTYEMWDEQIPILTGHFRVIRYDQRGHGGSGAPPGPYSIEELGSDALGILDAVGAARASLCGLSLGGMISMWLAANAPERIERMVISCTSANFAPPEFWTDRAAFVRSNGTSGLYGSLLERWFTGQIDVRNPGAKDMIASMLNACDPEGYAGVCEALARADLRAELSSISAPTLVIAGSFDPATPPATALSLYDAIADSSLVVIPDASHLANLEQPDLFVDAVMEHLVGSPKTRGMAVRTQVLGKDYVAGANARKTDFTAPFQDFISRYAWGEIWTRPGLDRRSRSMITLAILVSLGHLNELSFHIPAALRNGLSREEIAELLIQCAVYAGVPAANSAFSKANEILQSLD